MDRVARWRAELGTNSPSLRPHLPDKAAAEAEKRDAHKLGAFLKEQLQARAMGNEEFFHHQLRERIAADERETRRARAGRRETGFVADRPVGLGRRHVARDLLRLHIFCPARKAANRPITISHANSECPGRSGREPKRDDLDV